MQKLVVNSFPEEANREACSAFLIGTFMKGCKNKSAVLSAAEKKPKTLEEAYKCVLEATHLRKAILGKKAVKQSILIDEDSATDAEDVRLNSSSDEGQVYAVKPKTVKKKSSRYSKEDSLKDVLATLTKVLKDNQSDKSPSKKSSFFECGEYDHFVKDCPVHWKRRDDKIPDRSDNHNWRARDKHEQYRRDYDRGDRRDETHGYYSPRYSPDRRNSPRGYNSRGYSSRGYSPRGYSPRGYYSKGYSPRNYSPR